MGKLTINLCEELHQKIREDVAADESLTTSLLMERIIREHYEGPKPRPRIESGGRTMAFSVSEELFQRVKRYLAAHGGQSQRDFVIGLVTQGLALWEQGKALKMLEGYTPQKGDRTLAFAVTEELFHQIKAYIALFGLAFFGYEVVHDAPEHKNLCHNTPFCHWHYYLYKKVPAVFRP